MELAHRSVFKQTFQCETQVENKIQIRTKRQSFRATNVDLTAGVKFEDLMIHINLPSAEIITLYTEIITLEVITIVAMFTIVAINQKCRITNHNCHCYGKR